jgi:hypothetical protein
MRFTGNDFPIAYCVDRKGACYDFETGTGTEHAVEIIILRSPCCALSCVSLYVTKR